MKFEEFNLSPMMMKSITSAGYKEPTQIQERCIPLIKQGKDVVAQSETGSGKTVAFGLPVLENIVPKGGIQALVLTPTRELCIQVSDVFRQFGRPIGVYTASIYGGVGIGPQFDALRRSEIVVGTPGRILDHIERRSIDFSRIKFLIVDEVDKMAEMGFMEPVEEIISHLPKKRQTLLFSATLSNEVDTLAQKHSHAPIKIMTEAYVSAEKLRQVYYDVQSKEKFSLLVHLLQTKGPGLKLIFCATRTEVDIVHKNLKSQGIKSAAIHGGLSQNRRLLALRELKEERIDALVATDVAARGLDIPHVTFVYNYDVPKSADDYVHRIGRTARAGKSGEAITLLTDRDYQNFDAVLRNRDLNIQPQEIPKLKWVPFTRKVVREERAGFSRMPHHNFPTRNGESGGRRDFAPRRFSGERPEGRSFERRERPTAVVASGDGFENRAKESDAPGRSGYTGYSERSERRAPRRFGSSRPSFSKRSFHK